MVDYLVINPLNLKYSITSATPLAKSDYKGFDKIKFTIEIEDLDNNHNFKKNTILEQIQHQVSVESQIHNFFGFDERALTLKTLKNANNNDLDLRNINSLNPRRSIRVIKTEGKKIKFEYTMRIEDIRIPEIKNELSKLINDENAIENSMNEMDIKSQIANKRLADNILQPLLEDFQKSQNQTHTISTTETNKETISTTETNKKNENIENISKSQNQTHTISTTETNKKNENIENISKTQINLKSSNFFKRIVGIESNYKKDLIKTLEDIKKNFNENDTKGIKNTIDNEIKILKKSNGNAEVAFDQIRSAILENKNIDIKNIGNGKILEKIDGLKIEAKWHNEAVDKNQNKDTFLHKLLEKRENSKGNEHQR